MSAPRPVEVVRGDGPVIFGLPHTGTAVPGAIFARLNETGRTLADTDWHIDRLYGGLLPGATTVRATFHRYVIDANRGPDDASLYPGQNTTGLCPVTEANLNKMYPQQTGIAITPTWVRFYDFGSGRIPESLRHVAEKMWPPARKMISGRALAAPESVVPLWWNRMYGRAATFFGGGCRAGCVVVSVGAFDKLGRSAFAPCRI